MARAQPSARDVERAYNKLGTRDVVSKDVPFGTILEKGNWTPPKGVESIVVDGHSIELGQGLVLHERVLIVPPRRIIHLRSHEETPCEVATHIGDEPFLYRHINQGAMTDQEVFPEESIYSVSRGRGFIHGFSFPNGGTVYIAKALRHLFIEGNSFRIPKNAYQEKAS